MRRALCSGWLPFLLPGADWRRHVDTGAGSA